jgi:prolipoprotein diacylglyceryltransferase
MTFPLDLHLGREAISLHVVFETLGFFLGFRYFLYLRKKQTDTIPDNNRIWIIIGATFGAFLFSRILGALENPPTFARSQHPLLYLYANKTVVGALLGGLLGTELTKKAIGEKQSSGDLFTYPLMLAMIIGRIGCFTSGLTEETYGIPTRSGLGIDLGDGLPRHPVTLYEITFLILLWLGLRTRPLKSGYRFQFFLIAYLAFRFLLDFIKPHYSWFFGIGSIQLACLLGLIYYASTIWKIFTNFSALTNGK